MLVAALLAPVVVVVGHVLAVDALFPARLARIFAVLVVVLVLPLNVFGRLLDLHLLSTDALVCEPLLAAPAFGTEADQAIDRTAEQSHPAQHQQDPLHLSPVTHSTIILIMRYM